MDIGGVWVFQEDARGSIDSYMDMLIVDEVWCRLSTLLARVRQARIYEGSGDVFQVRLCGWRSGRRRPSPSPCPSP